MSTSKINLNSAVVRDYTAKLFADFIELTKNTDKAVYTCNRNHIGSRTLTAPQLEIRCTLGRGAKNRFSVYTHENFVSVTVGSAIMDTDTVQDIVKKINGVKFTDKGGVETRFEVKTDVAVRLMHDALYKVISDRLTDKAEKAC